jgi:hypothetical protein
MINTNLQTKKLQKHEFHNYFYKAMQLALFSKPNPRPLSSMMHFLSSISTQDSLAVVYNLDKQEKLGRNLWPIDVWDTVQYIEKGSIEGLVYIYQKN